MCVCERERVRDDVCTHMCTHVHTQACERTLKDISPKFSLSTVGSEDQTRVIRLGPQTHLPAKPSHRPWSSLLKNDIPLHLGSKS